MAEKKKLSARLYKDIKSRWPLLLICLAMTSGFYYALKKHYLPTTSAIGMEFDLIYALESKVLDLKFNLRGPIEPSGKIGILAVDEVTLMKFGDFPFSRKFYGNALRNLKKLGVKNVGFDISFNEPQAARIKDVLPIFQQNLRGLKPAQLSGNLKKWLELSPGDADFAAAIKDTGFVTMGYYNYEVKREAEINLGTDPTKYFVNAEHMMSSELVTDLPQGKTLDSFGTVSKAYGFKSNYLPLTLAADKFAFFSNNADFDAINRWNNLVVRFNGSLMPSLGLKIAAEHLDKDVAVFFNDIGIESVSLMPRDGEGDSVEVPTDPNFAGRQLIRHIGGSKGFKHYSLADAYFNTYSEKEKKELRGMSLLVGGTATGTQDLRPNPFDPAIDGVENHAAVAESIVASKFMRREFKYFNTELRLLLAIGIVFVLLAVFSNSLASGLALVVFIAGFWAYDWYFLFSKGYWGYTVVHSLQAFSIFMVGTFYKYVTEEREKQAVKEAFQHYLSPEVINDLLDDPSSMSLGGTKKEITIFFSDVRGFTSISEKLAPEKLCEFMNDYFTPMASVILGTGGTLDKYIGDAIMAFWGAPISVPNHAERAARACLQMSYELDKLQQEFPKKGFDKPEIGMGLNTTLASVGNMGSNTRFSYTAMGDGVNLGSRLEGLTKEYGIRIMVSEFTAKHLDPKEFILRDLDDIKVKGKNEAVKVFELVRPDILPSPQAVQEFLAIFHQGREAYKKQNWDEAEGCFKSCLAKRPGDGPSELFMERIAEYRERSPGEKWNGVYAFDHK